MSNKFKPLQEECPFLGFGVGLRPVHYASILQSQPAVDWFEILSENYLVPGGKPLYYLDQIRERYPVVMHGVSLSIGSADPLDWNYLAQLKKLAERVQPKWISDHTCWSSTGRHSLHDLLPVPQTEEAAWNIIEKVKQVQDFFGQRIMLENISSYLEYSTSSMTEWDFIRLIAEESDSLILLDVNNVYVSSQNHGFDPLKYIEAIPTARVGQYHLSGHSNKGTHLLDTHDALIIDEVWQLYQKCAARFGEVSTLIEWDDHIPPFEELLAELMKAKDRYATVKAELQSQPQGNSEPDQPARLLT